MAFGHLARRVLRPRLDGSIIMAIERAVIDALGFKERTGSLSSIAASSRPLASYGVEGMTVFSPDTWVKILSGD